MRQRPRARSRADAGQVRHTVTGMAAEGPGDRPGRGETQRHGDRRERGTDTSQSHKEMHSRASYQHTGRTEGDARRQRWLHGVGGGGGKTDPGSRGRAPWGGPAPALPLPLDPGPRPALSALGPSAIPEVPRRDDVSCPILWEHGRGHPLTRPPGPTYSLMQWAAVSTHWGCTRIPPHWKLL